MAAGLMPQKTKPVPFLDAAADFRRYGRAWMAALREIGGSGCFILGPRVARFAFLQATSLSDDSLRSEESLTEDIELPTPPPSSTVPSSVESGQLWKDIDQAEANDPLFSAEYTPEIFHYMREREVSNPCVSNFVQQHWLGTIKDTLYCLALLWQKHTMCWSLRLLHTHTQEYFSVEPYMPRQPDITAAMRTILVDWLVEVQENFELFHETLYIAVKLTDLYLSRREVKREYLQLVGATCMLIASKFEVPSHVADFQEYEIQCRLFGDVL